jgi:hypothetical protein
VHLQTTLEHVYHHILSLDTQHIFSYIAHMCGLDPDMPYELIAQNIFLLPENYFDHLTGLFVFTRVNRDTFLNFLQFHQSFINPMEAHTHLATHCLLFLQRGSLGMENTRVWKYAQAHWCDHLCLAQPNTRLLQLLHPSSSAWSYAIEQVERVLEWLYVSFSILELISPYSTIYLQGFPDVPAVLLEYLEVAKQNKNFSQKQLIWPEQLPKQWANLIPIGNHSQLLVGCSVWFSAPHVDAVNQSTLWETPLMKPIFLLL